MKKLTDPEIKNKLKSLLDWRFKNNKLQVSLEFDSFKDCMLAMNKIAIECESLNHHPEWTNAYNILDIKLTTHDCKGVSLLDFKLANFIDRTHKEC